MHLWENFTESKPDDLTLAYDASVVALPTHDVPSLFLPPLRCSLWSSDVPLPALISENPWTSKKPALRKQGAKTRLLQPKNPRLYWRKAVVNDKDLTGELRSSKECAFSFRVPSKSFLFPPYDDATSLPFDCPFAFKSTNSASDVPSSRPHSIFHSVKRRS